MAGEELAEKIAITKAVSKPRLSTRVTPNPARALLAQQTIE
jgi:hypothetical protein